jgi:hypothetical protein
MHPTCNRDTDGDGDCNWCVRHSGCPFVMFKKSMIDAATMSAEEIAEFKKNSQPFRYVEWLGVIRGFRDRDGRVLIENMELEPRK